MEFTPQTIYWKKLYPLPSLVVYTPYIKIMGQLWQIDNVGISSTVEHTYLLHINGVLYLESTSLSKTMIKATEILRDLNFMDNRRDIFDLNLRPVSSMCRTNHPIIGWKKAFSTVWSNTTVIVKLRIPEGTHCYLTEYKCRAQKAEILGVYDLNLNPLDQKILIHSIYRAKQQCEESLTHCKYQVGDTLVVDDFNYGYVTCFTGIHFFRSPLLAREYNY